MSMSLHMVPQFSARTLRTAMDTRTGIEMLIWSLMAARRLGERGLKTPFERLVGQNIGLGPLGCLFGLAGARKISSLSGDGGRVFSIYYFADPRVVVGVLLSTRDILWEICLCYQRYSWVQFL